MLVYHRVMLETISGQSLIDPEKSWASLRKSPIWRCTKRCILKKTQFLYWFYTGWSLVFPSFCTPLFHELWKNVKKMFWTFSKIKVFPHFSTFFHWLIAPMAWVFVPSRRLSHDPMISRPRGVVLHSNGVQTHIPPASVIQMTFNDPKIGGFA